jgi:anthraniloyl-CoA monooxygenase
LQRAALASSEWFEDVEHYTDQDTTQFAYSLSNRRGEYPLWRYLLHVAVQRKVARIVLRRMLSGRRWLRARRRHRAAHDRHDFPEVVASRAP